MLWLLFYGQAIAVIYTLARFPQWPSAAWLDLTTNSIATYCAILAVWVSTRVLARFRTAAKRVWKLALYWLLLNIISYIILVIVAALFSDLQSILTDKATAITLLAHAALLVCLLCSVATYQLAIQHTRHQQSNQLQRDRLQALHARIRPHFLFNGMNSVSSLIPVDPGRAETILQNLADVFRIVLADARKLVPLSLELELSRQYLEIEQLRMGERLTVEWKTEHVPLTAMVPSLILQPLIENSVYHGIEPSFVGGMIAVEIWQENERLHFMISNPLPEMLKPKQYRKGNKIALDNVRERLAYHFGREAYMSNFINDKNYFVKLALPIQY